MAAWRNVLATERIAELDRFEFAPPLVFEESFEEQEDIDGYHQGEVFCDITVRDIDEVKRPPASFGWAVERHLRGRLPALPLSRYQQILFREEA